VRFRRSQASGSGYSPPARSTAAEDLRARYGPDDEDIRALGSRLANPAAVRRAENLEFANSFTDTHRETFQRLAE
jgi:hypothetical protein